MNWEEFLEKYGIVLVEAFVEVLITHGHGDKLQPVREHIAFVKAAQVDHENLATPAKQEEKESYADDIQHV